MDIEGPVIFSWSREFHMEGGLDAFKRRLPKEVDASWRWSFLLEWPMKAFYGTLTERGFTLFNTHVVMSVPFIRLDGEWDNPSTDTIRIRFSNPWALWIMILLGIAVLLGGAIASFLALFSGSTQVWLLLGLALFGILALAFLTTWLQYRAVLRTLIKLGLRPETPSLRRVPRGSDMRRANRP